MPALAHNIVIEQGATFILPIMYFTDKAKTRPVDLTGYAAQMQIRAAPDTADPIYTALSTDDPSPFRLDPAGNITLTIPAEVTAQFPGNFKGLYDIELVAPNSRVIRLVQGSVTVTPEITKVSAVQSGTSLVRFLIWKQLADTLAWPDTYGIHPVLWNDGYDAWHTFNKVRRSISITNRVVVGWTFGGDPGAGYRIDGDTEHLISPFGPRQTETRGFPDHFLGDFARAYGELSILLRAKGGELGMYMGPPAITYTGKKRDWVREVLDVGAVPWWDSMGAVDHDTELPCVALADDLQTHDYKQYLETHDLGSRDAIAPWYTGKYPFVSLLNRAELVINNQPHWRLPTPPAENIVLILENDLPTRFTKIMSWLGKVNSDGSRWSVMADDDGLTDLQCAQIMAAARSITTRPAPSASPVLIPSAPQ